MKLPKVYYEQINKAIAKQQIPSQSFSYIKKRGWVYINHIPSGDYFSFFRKKSVAISAHNHQWENREVFKTKFSGGIIEEKGSWEDVMVSFTSWLKAFSNKSEN